MTTPEDFELGVPHGFDWLTGQAGVNNDDRRPDGVWIEVKGGDLPVPVIVRIDQTQNGRFIITGLLIGRDEHREITWTTLREIKPASILSTIFSGWDPHFPDKLLDDTLFGVSHPRDIPSEQELSGVEYDVDLDPAGPPESGSADALELAREDREAMRALRAYEIWRMTGGQQAAGSPAEEVTRPRASVATNLTEFADAYRRNFAANPRRATTATATQLHISRATAIRRIAECRQLGLLPPKG